MYLCYCKGRFGVGVGVKFNKTQSKFLYSLYTHNCTATQSSNVIVKFANDTTVIGLITDNDETAYREEVSTLTKWCQENHLSLNIDKTKELVVDYRRQSREHTPITIDKTPVERVSSFKFLGVHITEESHMVCSHRCSAEEGTSASLLPEKAEEFWNEPQHPSDPSTPALWRASWPAVSPPGLETARVMWTDRHIVGSKLPSLQDNLHQVVYKESPEDHQGLQPPVHRLLSLLPSEDVSAASDPALVDLRDSFFPQAIRLMNSKN